MATSIRREERRYAEMAPRFERSYGQLWRPHRTKWHSL